LFLLVAVALTNTVFFFVTRCCSNKYYTYSILWILYSSSSCSYENKK